MIDYEGGEGDGGLAIIMVIVLIAIAALIFALVMIDERFIPDRPAVYSEYFESPLSGHCYELLKSKEGEKRIVRSVTEISCDVLRQE